MSDHEAERLDADAMVRLEDVVGRVLRRVGHLEARLRESEERREELHRLLEGFHGGGEDPAELARRAKRLEEENAVLRQRLEDGRGAVERILARVRFLEENV